MYVGKHKNRKKNENRCTRAVGVHTPVQRMVIVAIWVNAEGMNNPNTAPFKGMTQQHVMMIHPTKHPSMQGKEAPLDSGYTEKCERAVEETPK